MPLNKAVTCKNVPHGLLGLPGLFTIYYSLLTRISHPIEFKQHENIGIILFLIGGSTV